MIRLIMETQRQGFIPPPADGDLTTHPDAFTQLVDIRDLNDHGLESYLEGVINVEDGMFPGANTAEHKLAFLLGGDLNDTTTARISDGSWVIKRKVIDGIEEGPGNPRAPEILEAVVEMSDYFDRVKYNFYDERPEDRFQDQVRILSEVSDVAFNLLALALKDPSHDVGYREYLQTLSINLGFETNREVLLIAAVKYKSRYIDQKRKDPLREDALISELLRPDNGRGPRVRIPSDIAFGNTSRWLNEMAKYFLTPRVEQIPRQEKHRENIPIV